MTVNTYRVAILGCRNRGTAEARAYHAHPRTEIVALCDLVQELLDTLGDEVNVPPSARYRDLDAMMRDAQPDIVAIPVGIEFHYPLAMRVLEYGANIEVEKPLCQDLTQADEIIAKAVQKGVRVAVHQQGRVSPYMQAVAQAHAAGRIGQVRYIYGSGKGYYGGYGLLDIGTHMLNNMLRFGGHVRSVSGIATTDGRRIGPEDVLEGPRGSGTVAGEHVTATLEFDHNTTGTLLQHRFPGVGAASAAYTLEVFGTEGRLVMNASKRVGGAWWLPHPHHLPGSEHGGWQPLDPLYPDHYDPSSPADPADYWFVEEYVRALDEARDHECSGIAGRHIMEIMLGVFESAAYGRRVDLPQPQRDHPLLRWRREQGAGPPTPMPRDLLEWYAAEDRRLGRE